MTDQSVRALVVNSFSASTIYVGTGTGVFKSTDGASSWLAMNAGLTSTDIFALILDPNSLGGADFDADGNDDLIVDFGSLGLWIHFGLFWGRLSPDNPEGSLLPVDLDNDGAAEVAVDFGYLGAFLWRWTGGIGGWTRITPQNPQRLLAAEIVAPGQNGLLLDLGQLGLGWWHAGN